MAHLATEPSIRIGLDASPWGMGAWLKLEGQFLEYSAVPPSEADLARFSKQRGSALGQQVWEALAMLLALRTWKNFWVRERVECQCPAGIQTP